MNDAADYTKPDFLDRLADQELANGNEVNAAALRRAHQAWKRDRELLREEQSAITPLRDRIHDLETRLANVQRAAAAA
jgi:hypothetical protein